MFRLVIGRVSVAKVLFLDSLTGTLIASSHLCLDATSLTPISPPLLLSLQVCFKTAF
jgi:hypothetical protein